MVGFFTEAAPRQQGLALVGLVRTQPWRTLHQAPFPPGSGPRVLSRDICQMGSLAGAAYLLHDNAGVLRQAQWEQNSHVEHKRKGLLD